MNGRDTIINVPYISFHKNYLRTQKVQAYVNVKSYALSGPEHELNYE
jgi:hypothetical protein